MAIPLWIAFILSNIAFLVLGYICIKLQTRHSTLRYPMWFAIVLGAISLAIRYWYFFM